MQLKAIDTNKGAESHIAGLYTQGPRMIFLIVIELRDRSLFIAWGGGVGGFWAKHDEI